MEKIIECVPNFSEGRNKETIKAITDAIESVKGIRLLDVDPGEATNRTVVTFVGEPDAVCEAAFRGVRRAAELIDMNLHHGAHPRMGATDVLPLIPVAGVTLEECAEMARKLAKRISDSLEIPTYCYEAAAFRPERRNLAVCRRGEYEGLPERMGGEDGPDFGHRPFDEHTSSSPSISTSTPPPRAAPTPSPSTSARKAVPNARAENPTAVPSRTRTTTSS